uniref:Structural protein of head n=1 Tax=Lygus hesperus TaxID=30085 RepID=A0A0A9VZ10_LYGHE
MLKKDAVASILGPNATASAVSILVGEQNAQNIIDTKPRVVYIASTTSNRVDEAAQVVYTPYWLQARDGKYVLSSILPTPPAQQGLSNSATNTAATANQTANELAGADAVSSEVSGSGGSMYWLLGLIVLVSIVLFVYSVERWLLADEETKEVKMFFIATVSTVIAFFVSVGSWIRSRLFRRNTSNESGSYASGFEYEVI